MTTLQQYFGLQLTMLKRQLIEWGLNPIAGGIFIFTAFYGFSFYLFGKTDYAALFYPLIAMSIVFQNAEINRNEFLKFIYPTTGYFKIRVAENLLTVVPFIIFLCYKKQFYPIILLVVLSTFFAFFNAGKKVTFTIPTPFYNKPFEFIVGFRKSLPGFLFAYFLTAMSATYHNFNLGVFSLLLVFLICLSFYSEPENEFYVWVHQLKVHRFIFDKIKTAILFSTILSLPITITVSFFFYKYMPVIIGFQALAYCYLLTIILAKYAAFPQKINLPQGILLALSITMPPLLLVAAPYFYIQSVNRLKAFLQ